MEVTHGMPVEKLFMIQASVNRAVIGNVKYEPSTYKLTREVTVLQSIHDCVKLHGTNVPVGACLSKSRNASRSVLTNINGKEVKQQVIRKKTW